MRAGEVLGIYGFMGSGQLELARALFGKLPAEGGSLRDQRRKNPAAQHRRCAPCRPRLRAGKPPLDAVPHGAGVQEHFHRDSRPHFAVLAAAVRERDIADEHVKSLRIRPPAVDRPLGTLSGGNQQKVALAKWLTYLPKVLVLSEPTRGMDVGAKDDVVKIVRGLREQGIGIVVVSTEPETVLSLADRILVMKKGRDHPRILRRGGQQGPPARGRMREV